MHVKGSGIGMNIQDFVIVRAARIVTKVLEKNLEAL
jgi:hypothetical protein